MNRKKAIQHLLVFASVGASSFSIYDWAISRNGISIEKLPQKKRLLAELAETIIPRTDTPGAKDAQVEDFIIKMITDSTDGKTQRNFLAGLSSLERYTYENYHNQFAFCSKKQQYDIVKYYQSKAVYPISIINKINNKFLGMPFFIKLKDLTVEGYCTSMAGATQGMAYDYIPATFEACIPLKKDQKAWATK